MRNLLLIPSILLAASGCADVATDQPVGAGDYTKSNDKADTSAEAVFVDFRFDGSLHASFAGNVRAQIEDQLLYTVGHLNGDRAVGRLDQLELDNIDIENDPDGGVVVSYSARLPVAWGHKNFVPTTYTLEIPFDISFSGQSDFVEKYAEECVDFGAHDVDAGSMWYYYRPKAFGCDLDDGDIVRITADVSLSTINTTGKYPEYHKVWEDETLKVVAVFGKYEDGATTSSDAGIAAYNRFTRAITRELQDNDLTTVPADVPFTPGVEMPDITFTADLGDGRSIEVVALLVDNVRTAGFEFNRRYEALSGHADLIVYNGHAGLGANIRALARKGKWVKGQYAIVFMNGCDTYAYVDSALADAHAAVNPDDPNGTKYLDIMTNALPSFFRSMSGATMAVIRGLLDIENPKTYEQIFANIDAAEVVLVSGEQDNVFVPGGGGGGGGEEWAGLVEGGSMKRGQVVRFETPVLKPGRYLFEMSGSGDADLYVRQGEAPTLRSFDCRPYKTGSNEVCAVDVVTPVSVHVMVHGYSTNSTFELTGSRQNQK